MVVDYVSSLMDLASKIKDLEAIDERASTKVGRELGKTACDE